jgi:hypothetical protein
VPVDQLPFKLRNVPDELSLQRREAEKWTLVGETQTSSWLIEIEATDQPNKVPVSQAPDANAEEALATKGGDSSDVDIPARAPPNTPVFQAPDAHVRGAHASTGSDTSEADVLARAPRRKIVPVPAEAPAYQTKARFETLLHSLERTPRNHTLPEAVTNSLSRLVSPSSSAKFHYSPSTVEKKSEVYNLFPYLSH